MAAITFSYHSKQPKYCLEIRLTYKITNESKYKSIYTRSKITVEKEYWELWHTKTDFPNYKDIDKQKWVKGIKEEQYRINTELDNLKTFILNEVDKLKESGLLNLNKAWLENVVSNYYTPVKTKLDKEKEHIPEGLVDYFDFYYNYRKNEISESLRKKNNVIKAKLQRFEVWLGRQINLNEVNDHFKNKFLEYCLEQSYSQNTISRELTLIKTVCKHARFMGMEIHPQMDEIRIDRLKVKNIYLSFDEIEAIEALENLPDYLDNARDWLIISCYLGQRVSDFLHFNKEMIRDEEGKPLLEFTQKKTAKVMTIPMHGKVMQILEKRNGDFPRSISDVKYNEYIKKVAKKAGIIEMVLGSKKVEITPNSKQYRKVTKPYHKYELVSSHIGRRSFATNFYGKIPTTYLIYITGHSSEQMFLAYIGKSNKDLAKEVFKYFE